MGECGGIPSLVRDIVRRAPPLAWEARTGSRATLVGVGLSGLARTRGVADALSVRIVIVQATGLAATLKDTHHGGLRFFPSSHPFSPYISPVRTRSATQGNDEKLVIHTSR